MDWLPEDEVFVTASGFDPGEGEVATVVGNSGGVVTLEEPLRYDHFGSTSLEAAGNLQVC